MLAPRPGLLLLASIAFSVPLRAQSPVERSVTGVVTDSVNGRPIRSAVVYTAAQGTEVTADRNGRFTIEHVSVGDTILVVRSIGYVPVQLVLGQAVGTVDVGSVTLRPVATRLDQIAVEAEAVTRYPQLEQFYVRKQRGQAGEFVTEDEIERIGARRASEILERSPKLQVTCGRDNVRSGDENCQAKDRRGMGYRVFDGDRTRCDKELFVDGRLSRLTIDDVPVEQIAGVEIYAGPATTPAEFGQRRCGVIAIWTKGANR